MNDKKVVLGMSGGVDSSVAAVLLKQQGLEVIGVSMELYSCDRPMGKGCCTPKDRLDAKRICEQLGIAHDIIDLRSGFKNHVIDYFAAEYAKGRTPLPCAPCNRDVRFKALLDYADAVGAYWIATGHYARTEKNSDGSFSLLRGVDFKKDQSYFLWGLSQKELLRLQFPIGPFPKERVREMAREFGLAVSDKPDSQELCFVGDDDHTLFLEEHYPQYVKGPGDFVDETGAVIGRHRGLHAYTVGQRRGLGVGFGERRYVVKLDPEKNQIMLGSKEFLKATGLIAKEVHSISGSLVPGPLSMVRIRSTHKGVAADLTMEGETWKAAFASPQESVTPGQAAVFYDGDVCLGGGWIERGLS